VAAPGKYRFIKNFTISVSLLIFALSLGRLSLSGAQDGIVRFAVIGDYGSAGLAEQSVADLVKSWNPDFVVTTGDNNYALGEASTIDQNIGQYYQEFIYPYVGSYGAGATSNRFFPSLGNHDWLTAGAQPYLDYFTLPGNERYYSFTWGPVHLFAIDSDDNEPDGNTSNSTQAAWLAAELAASNARWKVVYMHHPPYSSGPHGSTLAMQWPYALWGAHAVLAAHDHLYERITDGDFPYLVAGLGGRSMYTFGTPVSGSQVRYNSDFGAMLVEASNESITFQFISRTGSIIDAYTLYASPSAHVPAAPSNLKAAAVSGSQINLAWTDNASNESGFIIERQIGATGTFAQLAVQEANLNFYNNSGLQVSTTYCYRIRAFNPAGESTNSNEACVTTPNPKDLVIEGLKVSSVSVVAGASTTVSYNVTNRGTVTVTENYTDRIYLSTNQTWDAGDTLLGTSHGHTADLAPNATHANSQAVTIPGGTAPGNYFILVRADALGTVVESNEGNNVTAVALTVTVVAGGKDLRIESLRLSASSVASGGSTTVSHNVVNRGTVTVTETYTDRIYLSTDQTYDAADILLGTSHGHTTDLAPNAVHSNSQAVTIPGGTAPGSYFILVRADALGAVSENNEGNNVTAAALTVTVSSKDLVIENLAVSPASVIPGGSLTLSHNVVNRGTVTVTETYTDRIYLSANQTYDAADILLGTSHGHTTDLAPNAVHSNSQSVTIPSGTATGSYFILVRADALGAVAESNEGNNVTAAALTVP